MKLALFALVLSACAVVPKQLGSVCRSNGECASAFCSTGRYGGTGWCSAHCASNADCAPYSECRAIGPANARSACTPSCGDDSDCARYDQNKCALQPSIDGTSALMCQ